MARPKSTKPKRVNLMLTVSPEVKDMLDYIRREKETSISEMVETYIRKEYRKLVKDAKAPEEQLPGQMELTEDFDFFGKEKTP